MHDLVVGAARAEAKLARGGAGFELGGKRGQLVEQPLVGFQPLRTAGERLSLLLPGLAVPALLAAVVADARRARWLTSVSRAYAVWLVAAFVFYGGPPEKDAMAHIKAPVYGFYAGNDARIDATIPDTLTAMKAAGKSYDPVTYDGAGHGFMRAGEAPDANDANKKARTDAWARWKSLLAK